MEKISSFTFHFVAFTRRCSEILTEQFIHMDSDGAVSLA